MNAPPLSLEMLESVVRRTCGVPCGSFNTTGIMATAVAPTALEIMLKIGEAERILSEHQWRMPNLSGMRIFESPLCVVRNPVRPHKRQRWDKRGTYHRRVQKKWTKRFGEREEMVAYMLSPEFFVGPGGSKMFLLHPKQAVMLRNIGDVP